MDAIIELFAAALTPVIALIAVYVAWQQHRVNQFRLRHELYEPRLKVYRVVQEFLTEIAREAGVEHTRTSQFYCDASETTFLFKKAVQEYVDKLYSEAIKMHELHEELNPSDQTAGLPEGEEQSRARKEQREILKWFMHQLPESKLLFRKHMGIS